MLIGRTFACANNHRIPVRIFNLKPETAILYKGTQIAILQPAQEIPPDKKRL